MDPFDLIGQRLENFSSIYDDDGPSAMDQGSRPMFADGQLVQPNVDGSRPGYNGDKVYSDNYNTIYNKKTKLYSKKVGRDKKLLTQNLDETKKQFFKRVSNYSTETAAERTGKFTKEIVDARSKIDSWTSNWLNNNLENYGVRDFEKMTSQLKKDFKTQSKKISTNKIKTTTESGFPNLSTSKGKGTAVSKNPFSYDNVTFYTPENPSGVDKYQAQWKKIFYKNKIQTTPGLKNKINDYFDFINLDKRGAPGGQTIKSFKNILDKDVLYLLSEKDSGLQKGSKFEVFNSFDDLAKPYNEFTAKINKSEGWKVNANLIEKELGLKKNSIKNSMVREQKVAAKFFGLDDLKGTGLEYSIEHGQGLSAAARSGNKDLMKTALNDLIGTTRIQNTTAGFGGFEATRGALIRDIEAGVNVKDNVASLNKLTKNAYKDLGVKSNIYSIKEGKLTSKPITTATTQADRFTQYAEKTYKDPVGQAAIDKKFGSLDNVLKTIAKPDQIRLAKIGCPGKANGGRIGFDQGLNVTACATKGVEKLKGDPSKLTPGDKANVTAITKTIQGGRFLKNMLGPTALAYEALFAAPFVAYEYAKGANKDEIISNATYGLFGKSEEEQLKEKYADYGKAQKLKDTYDDSLRAENLSTQGGGYRTQAMNKLKAENLNKKVLEQSKTFNTILPPSKGFKGDFDLNMFFNAQALDQKRREEFAKEKKMRSKKRDILKPSTGLEAIELAGGGIAKEAGDRSGPAPQSGPTPQGLQGLFNRVKKI